MAGSPRNLRPIVHAVINILFILGESSAIARLYTKYFILKQFGKDDWAMAMVSIVNCGQHAILYMFMSAGAGLPQDEVLAEDPGAMTQMLKYLYAEEIWYLFLHLLIKMSFLLFFLRLSQTKRFRRAVYFVMTCNVFVTVGTWILYSLQCIPLAAYWSPELYPDVTCLPFSLSLWLPASALIVVDWMIFFLPLSTVWGLKMTTRRRLQILAVVTTGGSSVVVSMLRLIVIDRFTKTPDFIWEVGNICIVSAAEMEVAIFAANMPGLHALLRHLRGKNINSSPQPSGALSGGRTGGGSNLASHPGHQLHVFSKNRNGQRLDDDDEEHAIDHADASEFNSRGDSEEELTGIRVKTQVQVKYDDKTE
jgi:hypothetical protein